MAKGSDFEREISKLLSLWWTKQTRDDVFWRTASSGARATQRSKKGQTTAQQYGDIGAIDSIGDPFIKTVTLELKCGYLSANIHSVLDRSNTAALQTWEEFIFKAYRSHVEAGSVTWAIITRRTRRTTWIWMPVEFSRTLREVGAFVGKPQPSVFFDAEIRHASKRMKPLGYVSVFGCLLSDFLADVHPFHIKRIYAMNS
jgi:hypothetical protein